MPRMRLSRETLLAGVVALLAWTLFAALAPTVLGIDHRGLISIVKAGDHTALRKGYGDYPLRTLAPVAAAFGLLALGAMALLRDAPGPPLGPREPGLSRAPREALSA
jgi:hypothetical protein